MINNVMAVDFTSMYHCTFIKMEVDRLYTFMYIYDMNEKTYFEN